jgi:integrase
MDKLKAKGRRNTPQPTDDEGSRIEMIQMLDVRLFNGISIGSITVDHGGDSEKEQESIKKVLDGLNPTSAPVKPSPGREGMLSEVIDQFIDFKKNHDKKKWTDGGIQQTGRLKTILEIIGDKPCGELTDMDAIKVEETLPKLPVRVNQGELAKLPSIQAKIDTDSATHLRIGKNTQSKYWEVFCQFVDFAKKKKFLATNLVEDRVGISVSKQEKREAEYDRFTDDELQRLFNGHIYQPEKLRRSNGHSYQFWLPLLAAYTGARQNELCQLNINHIKESDDSIWYIDITDEEEGGSKKKSKDKSLKSDAAKRLVPIHSKLIELGFLDFVKEERTGPYAHMLFSTGLTQSKTGKWNKNASKWFNGYGVDDSIQSERGTKGYKQHCGFTSNTGKVFHSFRKSFATNLYNQEANMEELSKLIGHESGFKTTHIYIKERKLARTKEYIEKLEYSIDLSHVRYELFRSKYI